MLQYSVCYSSQ